MRNLFFLVFLFSACTSIRKASIKSPVWVDGIRTGQESLKIVNGNKLLYRRLVSAEGRTPQDTCDKALEQVTGDLQNEYLIESRIPYTLEYLHYDETYQDCATTISISSQLSSRLAEIKEIKKNHEKSNLEIESKWKEAKKEKQELEIRYKQLEDYIRKNQHLLSSYNKKMDDISSAISMLKDRSNNSKAAAFTGLEYSKFKRLVGHNFNIVIRTNNCWQHFKTMSVSFHGTVVVCWSGSDTYTDSAYILGFCDSESGSCWTKKP